jgi:hypothetical protein
MQLNSDDVAAIYARACRAWYGKKALRVVTGKVRDLERRGDAGGVVAWKQVAAALSQSKRSQHDGHGAERGKLY